MPMDSPPQPFPIRAFLRGLGLYLLVASLPALLAFLYSGDFFDAYHGVAACHRPLPRADGDNDRFMRFVLVREGQLDLEVRLPAAPLARYNLPRCPDGVPGRRLPEDAPAIHKDAFSVHFAVDARAWPTLWPGDLLLPLLLLLVGVPLRNWLATGSALRFSTRGPPPPRLGEGVPPPPSPHAGTGFGPPPGPRRKGKRRR
ncbi:MAG: hypothetical protein ABIO70_19950 [Pseudomonadota bacterium]